MGLPGRVGTLLGVFVKKILISFNQTTAVWAGRILGIEPRNCYSVASAAQRTLGMGKDLEVIVYFPPDEMRFVLRTILTEWEQTRRMLEVRGAKFTRITETELTELGAR